MLDYVSKMTGVLVCDDQRPISIMLSLVQVTLVQHAAVLSCAQTLTVTLGHKLSGQDVVIK